jgi:uncharacterized protein with PIN domain
VRLYAESSAVLAWLLGEESASRLRALLAEAEIVVASDLTLIECARDAMTDDLSRSIRAERITDRQRPVDDLVVL